MEMLFITWTDKYKTGIPILDEQYRGLVSLINSFFFHRSDEDINHVLVPAAEMFKAYAKINFYTVEKLLRGAGYPDVEAIVEKQHEILRTITVMEQRTRALRDAPQFLDFLKEYWASSVENLSGEYVSFLRDHYGSTLP